MFRCCDFISRFMRVLKSGFSICFMVLNCFPASRRAIHLFYHASVIAAKKSCSANICIFSRLGLELGVFSDEIMESVIKIQKECDATPSLSDDWIVVRIAQAMKKSCVADSVALEIKSQLSGTMCERPLRPAELGVLAKKLLEATDDPPVDEVVN